MDVRATGHAIGELWQARTCCCHQWQLGNSNSKRKKKKMTNYASLRGGGIVQPCGWALRSLRTRMSVAERSVASSADTRGVFNLKGQEFDVILTVHPR